MNHTKAILGSILSIALLIPPLSTVVWWIYVVETSEPGKDQAALRAAFESVFPEVLRDAQLITLIVVGFSVGAVVAGFSAKKHPNRGWRVIGAIAIWTGSVMAAWQVFTLM